MRIHRWTEKICNYFTTLWSEGLRVFTKTSKRFSALNKNHTEVQSNIKFNSMRWNYISIWTHDATPSSFSPQFRILALATNSLHNQCKLKKKCDITVRNQLGQTERKYFCCRTNHSCERSIQLSTEQQTCHMQHTMHFDCRWLSVVDDQPGLCKNILLDLGRKRATDEGYASCWPTERQGWTPGSTWQYGRRWTSSVWSYRHDEAGTWW